ncbi:LysR family transcriptional regulator [Paraneptunicella aestuarii]|uniref:LysR family transcriptional regulator n=1 Tax=Paraneptunicella aestuarii TaxID=2831148 RepID=UPI001E4F871D|nr:LysR family transcriptional regulator [Paraneptunicella aestuarii]UAA40247.1 LysR family transcriptional regulator [Paraneptunicella aestuarii]
MYRTKTTLEQWRILQAVVDSGGYAHAAKLLNKSQSSLNHAVAKLQDQLNVQLLEVKGRKAFLTPAGEVMLRRSRILSQSAQDLEELAKNINQGWEPEITIALDLAFPREYLLPVLKQFQHDCRGSRLKIIDTVLTGTEEAITEGWADIVLTANIPKGHLYEPLVEVDFIAVSHPEHPLATLESPIDPEELLQHIQIVIKDTGKSPVENRGWLKAEQRWTVSQFHAAIELLHEGIGFCWLPTHYVQPLLKKGSLAQLSIKGSSFRRIVVSMVNPHPDRMGPGTRMLTEMILAERQITQ